MKSIPVKSILDPSFRYTPSVSTDLRKTFARIRRLERESQAAACETAGEVKSNVLHFEPARKAATSTTNRH